MTKGPLAAELRYLRWAVQEMVVSVLVGIVNVWEWLDNK